MNGADETLPSVNAKKARLAPIFPLGWYWIAPAALLDAGLSIAAFRRPSPALVALAALAALAALFLIWFFRDPEREPSAEALWQLQGKSPILSPADGKIADIAPINGKIRIGIFLSPLDVHVQWAPFEGKVVKITRKGLDFFPAYDPRASDLNVSVTIDVDHPRLGSCAIRQITGILVRRILTQSKEGASLKFGQRLGMILLGSRVELELPSHAQILVKTGDHVYGGQTIIACY